MLAFSKPVASRLSLFCIPVVDSAYIIMVIFDFHGTRPTIRQTAINQRAPWFPPYVINNEPAIRNSYHHSRSEEDGILGYAPSTQPQHVGTCLNCPPKQVQQIIQPYQNKYFFGLQRSLVPLALQFAHAIAHAIQQTH
ncbi:unnamed protein product [Schistosoma rodhaini]|nr:unnamed protein product [Schistosoma rodhaini]